MPHSAAVGARYCDGAFLYRLLLLYNVLCVIITLGQCKILSFSDQWWRVRRHNDFVFNIVLCAVFLLIVNDEAIITLGYLMKLMGLSSYGIKPISMHMWIKVIIISETLYIYKQYILG